jgi:hypothetical protein
LTLKGPIEADQIEADLIEADLIEADLIEAVCDARRPVRDPAVACLRPWLHFEPAGDGGCSERSPRRWV